MKRGLQYFVVNKPYGVVSQFKPEQGKLGLGSLYDFPTDVYPVGRLDHDSEGMLILTNDGSLNKRLLHPNNKVPKTYLTQVEGMITDEAVERLTNGVLLKDGKTLPAIAEKVEPVGLPERNPPVRFRASIPTSWVKLTIIEGRNRQVRRMTAAVGFPTLRLIRIAIGRLELVELAPGAIRALSLPELLDSIL